MLINRQSAICNRQWKIGNGKSIINRQNAIDKKVKPHYALSIAHCFLPIAFCLLSIFLPGCTEHKKEQQVHQMEVQETYTCPMHPQIVSNKPGSCPICGMDLVKQVAASNSGKINDLTLNDLVRPANQYVISAIATVHIQE